MKTAFTILLLVGCFLGSAFAQDRMVTPRPPAPDDTVEPPMFHVHARPPTPQELQRQSLQLQQLVESVQPKLDKASQGVLDKDLMNKLKAIEKLAHKLRTELN